MEVSNGKFVLGTGIESRRFSGETLPKSRFCLMKSNIFLLKLQPEFEIENFRFQIQV